MRLIKNWRAVAARSHSMWAVWLGILALLAPDLMYVVVGWDTNPRWWWIIALVLLLYGAIGRLLAQGIDHSKTQSPIWVALAVVLLAGGGAYLTAERPHDPAPVVAVYGQEEFLSYAVPLVSRWEGLETTAYLDKLASPPVWTVCYGETVGVQPGDSYSEAECAAMLGSRILDYRAGLHSYLTDGTLAQRLPATRDAAYSSLTYNIGISAAGRSTAVKRLNAGDVAGGCEAIGWWNKAGGRVLRGLVNRRAEERELCLVGLRA